MPESTIIDLGQKVKAKYPGQYDDIPDAEVGRRVKAKYPGQYDDFKDVATDPNAAVKAAQAAKYPTKAEGGNPDLPWYAGYFNQGNDPSRTAGQVAQDQAANVIKGIPEAVTGIPTMLQHLASMGWKGATGNVSGMVNDAGSMVKEAASPIVTPVKQGIELAKPGLVNAPGPDSPESAQAAEGAGAMLGVAELPNVVSGAGVLANKAGITPKVSGAWDQIQAKVASMTKRPDLTAAEVNKWMDVPASAVTRGANPGQLLLDEKLLGATKEATKANVDSALASTGQQIEQKLTNAPGEIDAQTPVYDAAAKAVKRIGRPRDEAFQRNITGVIDDIEGRYPNLNKLTPKDAHALKVELGDSIKWKGAAFDEPVNQMMVQIYHDLNKTIKASVPDIGDLQSRWGDLKIASKNLNESMADDVVGKGTGAEAPEPPDSMAAHLAKMGVKWGARTLLPAAGKGAAYEIGRSLKEP